MDYDDFIGEVQQRTQLSSREDALRATRATLTTLGERIQEGEAENLAAQLPKEVGRHVEKSEGVESFSYEEFVDRIAEREEIDPEDDRGEAVYHARVVVDVLEEAVSGGELEDVRSHLPADDEYDELFELAEEQEQPPE